MLLNSSAPEHKPVRERFSGPVVVAGIIASFLALLVLLYPEQALYRLLNKEGSRTPAGRVYLEALLRTRPADHQVRLTLAQTWLSSGCYRKALKVLDGFGSPLPSEIQQEADRLRYAILREWLLDEENSPAVRELFQSAARKQLQNERSDEGLARIEYDATSLGFTGLAETARRYRTACHGGDNGTAAAMTAEQYRAAARAAFESMATASTLVERRERFLEGVRSLQAGNLILEALQEGERHLTPLAADQKTLMFMTRIALAAGKPDKAQVFIRSALGMGKRL